MFIMERFSLKIGLVYREVYYREVQFIEVQYRKVQFIEVYYREVQFIEV